MRRFRRKKKSTGVPKKKKPVRNPKVPRTRAGGTWTEARFWSFLRTGIREMTTRWPPIASQLLVANRRASERGGNSKHEYLCADCQAWFLRKDVQVEHTIPLGSFTSWDHLVGYCQRAFVEVDHLRIVCKPCHKIKTDAENKQRRADKAAGRELPMFQK